MLSFNRALVIEYYVWFAFLFVQTVVIIQLPDNIQFLCVLCCLYKLYIKIHKHGNFYLLRRLLLAINKAHIRSMVISEKYVKMAIYRQLSVSIWDLHIFLKVLSTGHLHVQMK